MSRFNPDQQAAIQLRRNGVCSAGAGAGKTTVLAHRFLSLLSQENAEVDQILTLTFTRKASQEMYERIYHLLAQNREKHPAWMQGFLEFDRAQISTLDSFCTQIVRTGAPLFGIPSNFRVDEPALRDLVQHEVHRFLIEYAENPVVSQWVQAFGIEAVISQVLEPLGLELAVPGPVLTPIPESIHQDSLTLEKLIISSIDAAATQASQLSRLFESGFEELISVDPKKAKSPPAGYLATQEFLQKISEIEGALFLPELLKAQQDTTKGESPVSNLTETLEAPRATTNHESSHDQAPEDSSPWVEPPKAMRNQKTYPKALSDALQQYKVLVEGWRAIPDMVRVLANREAAGELSVLLEELRVRIISKKRAQGILTFSDLTLLAIAILQEDPELADYYRQRFRFIMIDEFQDNNDLQRRLLYLLAARPGYPPGSIPRGDEIRQNILFFVGDEKQSIYQFRGADVRVFKELNRDLAGGELILGTNYRSHPRLIDYFNGLFERIFTPHPSQQGENLSFEAEFRGIQSRNLQPGEDSGLIEFWLQPHDSQLDDSFLSPGENEALAIARRIRDLVDSKTPVWDRARGSLRPVEYQDIGVLYKSGSRQMDLERMLRYHGIPYQLQQVRSLFLDALASDFYSILQILIFPQDTEAWAALSRSPFLNLSYPGLDALLSWLDENRGNLHSNTPPEFSLQSDQENWQRFLQLHGRLSQAADQESPGVLIDILWIDGGYKSFVCSSPGNQVFLEHYDFFRAFVQGQADKPLASIVGSIRKNLGKFEKIPELTVLRPQAAGISLMSVHASKGLEFPVVILSNMGGGGLADRSAGQAGIITRDSESRPRLVLNAGFAQGRRLRNPHIDTLAEARNYQELAELRRLFYVACTRTEHHLLLFGSHNKQNKAGLTESDYWISKGKPRIPKNFLALLTWAYISQGEWPWPREDEESAIRELVPAEFQFSDGLVFRRIDPVSTQQWLEYRNRLSSFSVQGDSKAIRPGSRHWETTPRILNTTDIQRRMPTSRAGDVPGDAPGISSLGMIPSHDNPEIPGETSAQLLGSLSHLFVELCLRHCIADDGLLVNPLPSGDLLREGGIVPTNPDQAGGLVPRKLLQALNSLPDAGVLWAEAVQLAAGFFDSQLWRSWHEMAGVYLYPELPVLFSAKIPREGSVLGGSRLVRGTLDLLADLPEGRLVVDFKSDQHLVPEEYKTQLGLYCQAAAQLRLPGYPQRGQGSEPVKSALFSLRQGIALTIH